VQVYARPIDLSGPLSPLNNVGIEHQWLQTDQYEAGMGPTGGGVPGQQEPPDLPGVPVSTIDHSGQSQNPNAHKISIPFEVDDYCVSQMIKPGQSLGRFIPGLNDCHAFVSHVLQACRKNKPVISPFIPWKPR
jgi:hypothetical protein